MSPRSRTPIHPVKKLLMDTGCGFDLIDECELLEWMKENIRECPEAGIVLEGVGTEVILSEEIVLHLEADTDKNNPNHSEGHAERSHVRTEM